MRDPQPTLSHGKGVEWRTFGPVEEATEYLGLSGREAQAD
jgi:hypothetical protein